MRECLGYVYPGDILDCEDTPIDLSVTAPMGKDEPFPCHLKRCWKRSVKAICPNHYMYGMIL